MEIVFFSPFLSFFLSPREIAFFFPPSSHEFASFEQDVVSFLSDEREKEKEKKENPKRIVIAKTIRSNEEERISLRGRPTVFKHGQVGTKRDF